MQQSIEAFVADMSAELDAVDNGLPTSDKPSGILTLRRILYLLKSLKETLADENPARRHEASAALMAEFQQGMAGMSAGLAKVQSPAPAEPHSDAALARGFGEGEVVPFDRARRRAPAGRAKTDDSSADQPIDHVAERIADPHFLRPSDGELADVREQINTIVDRRRSARAGQDPSMAAPEAKRNPAADPLHPIGMAWRMLPGIIRNLEQQLGKSISFVTAGDRIEVNRSLIDAIRVPLIYLTRNAADHGLETSQERVRCGKSPVGTIRISVSRDADDVVVELSDDGRGFDAGKLARLAVAGFMAGEGAEGRAGSAAPDAQPAVDRGIGLDAVRRHIELAGGRIDLRSRPGCGVSVSIRIPAQDARASSASSSGEEQERAVCLPNFPR